jgi:hypothetical protein
MQKQMNKEIENIININPRRLQLGVQKIQKTGS